MDAKEQFLTLIRREQMLPPDCAVIAGVSGGADSVALLHLLYTLRQEGQLSHLEVVHVNHCLRGEESLRDQRFVEDLCQQLKIPLYVETHDVATLAKQQGKGVEELGRELRYAAFEKAANRFETARIATAHTADDNVETLLLHLCRGSGLHGAAGIPPMRSRIIRPLLTCTRREIEAYCTAHGLSYVTDSTNADLRYARNRVRLEVMPALRAINPQATAALTRFIDQVRQADELLQDLTQQAIAQATTEDGVYDCRALLQLPPALCARVLYQLTQTAEERHIQLLQAALKEGHGAVVLPTGVCWCVTAEQLVRRSAEFIEPFCFAVTLNEWYEIGDDAYRLVCVPREEYEQKLNISKRVFSNAFDYDRICGDLILRQRRDGDAFHPAGRNCGKSLKKLFNEEKTHKRDAVPVLCDQEGIVAVYGFECDERVRITPNTKTVLRIQKRGEGA